MYNFAKGNGNRYFSQRITLGQYKKNTMDAFIFDLSQGDKFILGETAYIVRKFFKKRRPKLGVVLHCEAVDAQDNVRWFLNNHKIVKIDN